MADNSSSSSTPSTPSSSPAPTTSTLGTNAAGQAQAAQVAAAQAKQAAQAPKAPPAQSSGAKQAQAAQAAHNVVNDPNASKAAKVEAKKMLKQLSIKVDGQDYTENLPFEIPDTQEARDFMTRELQMARMGQKRAQYASGLEKDIQKLAQEIKANPFKVLADPAFGVDVKEAVKKYIEQEIENSKKSPEQLALEKAQEELRQERESRLNEKKAQEAAEQQALADRYEKEYDAQISQALESHQIPRSAAAINKIISYAQLAVQANKDVSIQDIIPFVKEELKNDYLEHAKALPDDALEEFFGKDIVDRLRKTAVKRAKQAQQNPALKAPTKVAATGQASKPEEKPAEKVSYKTFFKPW
jgi:hypothetical protein